MQPNQSKKAETEKEKCPSSPDLEAGKFPYPQELDDKYFEDLPKSKINETKDKKEGLASEASLTKETTISAAEVIKQEGKSAFDIAQKKFDTDNNLLITQTKNKKSQHFRSFYQELRNAVMPEIQSSSVKKNNENSEKNTKKLVPDDVEAILIATLKKNLASEEIEYRKKLKEFKKILSEAESKFKLANDNYDADLCIAEAQELLDLCEAELIWRTDISAALVEINKE